MANAWLEHVKKVSKENKGMKFKEILQKTGSIFLQR